MGTEALNPRPEVSTGLIVPVEFVKTNFLFGVSLLDDDGNEMPDSLIAFYIRSATEWMEAELETQLSPISVVGEAHDLYLNDYTNGFPFMKLFRRPVRSMSKLTLEFPVATNAIEFDPEWFRVEANSGNVSLIPSQGSLSQFIIGSNGTFLPQTSTYEHIPFAFRVNYEAGYLEGKVPNDILEVIGMKAATGPLDIAGDLLGGAGIASKSISLDGLSESISTTSSPENSGYGGRLIQYQRQTAERMAILRMKYRSISMVVG